MKKLMLVTILALVMLVAVTPVMAAGSGSQNQHQNQEVEKNEHQPQNQEQNEGETQNQEENIEQNQNQEQNQHQLGEGSGNQSNGNSGLLATALPGTQLFTLTGTIAALEDGVSITVALHNGNRFIKRLVEDEQLLVEVTGATEYRLYVGGTCIPAEWDDLFVGATIHIKGTASVDAQGVVTFTAERVTVDVPCLPTPI